MKKLNVIYVGWGERYVLGVLADNGKELAFEYTPEAINRGLQVSPYKLPLSNETYSGQPAFLRHLPGLLYDCLPDGWGMLLMDRLFRKRGLNPARLSSLDRLAYLGNNAMGALVFEPNEGEVLEQADLRLLKLAQEVRQVFEEDESEAVLQKLILMGGSPHGARPKILVNFEKKTNIISTADSARGTPTLVKFPAQNEHKEVCAIEELYCRLARACGIVVPATQYYDLDKQSSAFGIARFDRQNGNRVLMHTASGAMHIDYRVPQLDYMSLLRLTSFLTRDRRQITEAFARCVYNVIFNNRDDHSKNFSFLLGKNGHWTLSPVYDLTYSVGPNGEHQMDVCGEARLPGRQHLLELASKGGIEKIEALEIIDRIATASLSMRETVADLHIREKTLKTIEKAIAANRAR